MLRLVLAIAAVAAVLALGAPDLTERLLASVKSEPQEQPAAEGAAARVMLTADRRGHFAADLHVNGRPMRAMVDTGASLVVLTYEDGRALGLIRPGDRYDIKMQTANGVAGAKRVSLNTVRLGGISVGKVEGIVAQEGTLDVNLIGMAFLNRLRTFEISNGRLILEQ